jgi:hypothetical protein
MPRNDARLEEAIMLLTSAGRCRDDGVPASCRHTYLSESYLEKMETSDAAQEDELNM